MLSPVFDTLQTALTLLQSSRLRVNLCDGTSLGEASVVVQDNPKPVRLPVRSQVETCRSFVLSFRAAFFSYGLWESDHGFGAQKPSACAQEQLERDGARVKIMTDHLVNVQQDDKEVASFGSGTLQECDSVFRVRSREMCKFEWSSFPVEP